MTAFLDLLAQNPILLLFAVVGIGWLVGSVRVLGFSLGPAAVLFVGIFFGAIDSRLRIPEIVYVLGLVLFVYTIGLQSGPTFFASFGRRAFRANVFVLSVIVLAAALTYAWAELGGLDGPSMVGVFCGSLTNTPALAESIETIRQVLRHAGAAAFDVQVKTSAPVIGYSVSYPFGVIGMLLGFYVMGKFPRRAGLHETTSSELRRSSGSIQARTYRVVNPGVIGKTVAAVLGDQSKAGLVLSRMRRGEFTTLVHGDTVLQRDDLVVAVGDNMTLERARILFGEESAADIQTEHRELDFRRIEVSAKQVVGRSIGDLNLQRLLDATITRIRRGEADFVPSSETVLERGDRVRVLTWAGNLDRVARYFGDSVRSSSEADLLSLSLGLVLGMLLGFLPIPLPGGSVFTLGFAGGPLVVGLVLGRMQRTAGINWGLPYGVNLTMRQIGLVLFLAGIGTKAGDGFVMTVMSGGGILMAAGFTVTLVTAAIGLFLGPRILGLSYSAVLGLMSGLQTQPACLAYANEHSSSDVANVWYASVYPLSMIAKIVLAQILAARLL
jgi:putative transport protein